MPRVAAIDVGSNAIRLEIVDVSSTGVLLHRSGERYALRLGQSVFARGRVAKEQRSQLLQVFAQIAERLTLGGVERVRAVATSAMRDAVNGRALAEEITAATGIELEIISGAEEGCLMRGTLARTVGTFLDDCVLVDLGGGSVEVERGAALCGLSLPMGSLRLLARYPELGQPLDAAAVSRLYLCIRDELRERLTEHARPADTAVGTGGNLAVLAGLVPVPKSVLPAIDTLALRSFVVELAALSMEERIACFGLRPDRADVIVPAALIVAGLVEVLSLRRFLVPGTGLREALVYELVAAAAPPCGAARLLRELGFEVARAQALAASALHLFELFAPLHRLWPTARGPLEVAAYMLTVSEGEARLAPARIEEALSASPVLTLSPEARAVARAVLGLVLGSPEASAGLSEADREVARLLGGLLAFARELFAADVRQNPDVDLSRDPVALEVASTNALPSAAVIALSAALGRRVELISPAG